MTIKVGDQVRIKNGRAIRTVIRIQAKAPWPKSIRGKVAVLDRPISFGSGSTRYFGVSKLEKIPLTSV